MTPPKMTARRRPRQRLRLILLIGFVLCLAIGLSAYGLRDYATYFRTPTDLQSQPPAPDTLVRIGGMVVANSFQRDGAKPDHYAFAITDNNNTLNVVYDGLLPDLFREGQGIVIEGYQREAGRPFTAIRVLAKHDEYYMPVEVKRAMAPADKP